MHKNHQSPIMPNTVLMRFAKQTDTQKLIWERIFPNQSK